MKYLYFLVLVLISGCSKPHPNHIDPAFKPMYDQFVKDAGALGVHFDADRGLTIGFASMNFNPNTIVPEQVGLCQPSGDSHGYDNTITVDPVYWSRATYYDQWILIYHELGHCVLGEGHTANATDIMYPVIGSNGPYFNQYRNSAVYELFEPVLGKSW